MDEDYLVAATARAIVAKALVDLRGEPGAGPSALYLISARTALVDAVRLALSPTTKGVFGWLFDRVRDFAAAKDQSAAAYAAFFHAMLDGGVYLPPSGYEAWFISAAHDEEALSRVADALPAAARAAATILG